MKRCPICKKKLTECYEDFMQYFECDKCMATFRIDETGKLRLWEFD